MPFTPRSLVYLRAVVAQHQSATAAEMLAVLDELWAEIARMQREQRAKRSGGGKGNDDATRT